MSVQTESKRETLMPEELRRICVDVGQLGESCRQNVAHAPVHCLAEDQ